MNNQLQSLMLRIQLNILAVCVNVMYSRLINYEIVTGASSVQVRI